MNSKNFLTARTGAARRVGSIAGSLAALATLLSGASVLLGAAQAAQVAGVEIPPPLPAGSVSETHWGTPVPDPYRHLENVKDPAVQQWLRAQADATNGVLARIPGRLPLMERMRSIEASVGGLTQRVFRADNGRLFFLRRNPGEDQFRLVWRDGPEGRDTVIVDPEAMSKAAGRPHAIMDYQPSPDGSKLAYSVQVGGGEIGVLHIVDVATSKPLLEPIDRIRFASTSWLADGSGFFYSRLREGYESMPPTERFQDRTRHYRSLDAKLDARLADRVVMSPSRNPELKLPSYASPYTFEVPGSKLAGTSKV
jgi:prolyl oligopeptidase